MDYKKSASYNTLCFTGRLHAPKGEQADVNLYVYRGEMREYHSMTAAVALIDALVVSISQKMGANSAENLQKIHKMKKKYWI